MLSLPQTLSTALDTEAHLPTLPLILATAFGYAVATFGMKGVAEGFLYSGIALSIFGFLLAFVTEVLLMRQTHLSVLYVVIIGAETLLVLSVAFGIGEGFTLRQAFGALMVLSGLTIVAV